MKTTMPSVGLLALGLLLAGVVPPAQANVDLPPLPPESDPDPDWFCTTPIVLGLQPCLFEAGHSDPEMCNAGNPETGGSGGVIAVIVNRSNSLDPNDNLLIFYAESCTNDSQGHQREQVVGIIDCTNLVLTGCHVAGVFCRWQETGGGFNQCGAGFDSNEVGVNWRLLGGEDTMIWIPFPWGQILP